MRHVLTVLSFMVTACGGKTDLTIDVGFDAAVRDASIRDTSIQDAVTRDASTGDTCEGIDCGVAVPVALEQEAYIKASNTAIDDRFGGAVAIDGHTLVVGARQADNGAATSGAVYVFVRAGDHWTQQAYLRASNAGAGDEFGASLALDGDTLVVGAPNEDSDANVVDGDQHNEDAPESGAAYVFTRSGDEWIQRAFLKAANSAVNRSRGWLGDHFGSSVAISADTIVVTAPSDDSGATGVNGDMFDDTVGESGAAHVFVRSGETWSGEAYLKASNTGRRAFFGRSVDVDSDTVVIGADGESSAATGIDGDQLNSSAGGSGASYVFVRASGTWSQQAYLKASATYDVLDELGGAQFGASVAVSGDTIVVSAPCERSNAAGVNGDQANADGSCSGAAYAFERDGARWTQQAYLKASNTGAFDHFGRSVAISRETIVVGAPRESSRATGVNGDQLNNGALASGAVYVFARSGREWAQQSYLKASNTEPEDYFGFSVAIANDTIAVGAFMEDSDATGVSGDQLNNDAPDSGAVYVFRATP